VGATPDSAVKIGLLAGSLVSARLAAVVLGIRNCHDRALCAGEAPDRDAEGVRTCTGERTNSRIWAGRAGKAGRRLLSAARKAFAMAASSASGPHESAPLSPREQKILAAIETELLCSDPDLHPRMRALAIGRGRAWAARGHRVTAGVVLLLVVVAVLPPAWLAILGLVLTLGVLPWFLLCRVERHTS
jgi:hypothetical protein